MKRGECAASIIEYVLLLMSLGIFCLVALRDIGLSASDIFLQVSIKIDGGGTETFQEGPETQVDLS